MGLACWGYERSYSVLKGKLEVDFTFSLYLIKIFSVLLDRFQRQRIRDAEVTMIEIAHICPKSVQNSNKDIIFWLEITRNFTWLRWPCGLRRVSMI